MNFKIKDLIYIWLLLLVQNAENRPLSCYVIDEKFGSMLCCRVSAGNSNCRTLIPKNTFQFVKTWPLETVRHANLLLRRFHKKEAEDSEFSSQFVSSDSFRREQIEEERKILEAIISEENEKKCCCERVKEIIIPNEGYSYDKDSHKIYQELPDRVQVAMSVSCISSNCTQNFKKFSCSKASAYVPLYVIDKEFPDYLQEVPIEVNKDCICEEEYIDHSQHVPTQNFKKELFKRFAKYDKINSRQINQELDKIRSVMKNNLYRSHNVNNTFKLFEDVVKNFNHTYIKAAENIKFVNKTNNKYEENFFDAASLILIATKLLNFNISYSDSTSKETASSGDWDISSRNSTDKLSSETYAQTKDLDATVIREVYKNSNTFDKNSRELVKNVMESVTANIDSENLGDQLTSETSGSKVESSESRPPLKIDNTNNLKYNNENSEANNNFRYDIPLQTSVSKTFSLNESTNFESYLTDEKLNPQSIKNVTNATRIPKEKEFQVKGFLQNTENNTTDFVTENSTSSKFETELFSTNYNSQSRFLEDETKSISPTLQDISPYKQTTQNSERKRENSDKLEDQVNRNRYNSTSVNYSSDETNVSTVSTTTDDFTLENLKTLKAQDHFVDDVAISLNISSSNPVHSVSDENLVLETINITITDSTQKKLGEDLFQNTDYLQTSTNTFLLVTDNSEISTSKAELLSNGDENKDFGSEQLSKNKSSINLKDETLKELEPNINNEIKSMDSVVTEAEIYTNTTSRNPQSSKDSAHIKLIKSTSMVDTEFSLIMTNDSNLGDDSVSEGWDPLSLSTEKALEKSVINYSSTEDWKSPSWEDSSIDRKNIIAEDEDMNNDYNANLLTFLKTDNAEKEFFGAISTNDDSISTTENIRKILVENLTERSQTAYDTDKDLMSSLAYNTNYNLKSRSLEVDKAKSISPVLQDTSQYTQAFEDYKTITERVTKYEDHFNENNEKYHNISEPSEGIFTDASGVSTTTGDFSPKENVTTFSGDTFSTNSGDYVEFGKTFTTNSEAFTVTSIQTIRKDESISSSNLNFGLDHDSFNNSTNIESQEESYKDRNKTISGNVLVKGTSEREFGLNELEKDSTFGVSTSISVDSLTDNLISQTDSTLNDNQVTLSENSTVNNIEATTVSHNRVTLSEESPENLTSLPIDSPVNNEFTLSTDNYERKFLHKVHNASTLSDLVTSNIPPHMQSTPRYSTAKDNQRTIFEESLSLGSVADKQRVKLENLTSPPTDSRVYEEATISTDTNKSRFLQRDHKTSITLSELVTGNTPPLKYISFPNSSEEIRKENSLLDKIIQDTTLGKEIKNFFSNPHDDVNNTTPVVTTDSYLKIHLDKSVEESQPKLVTNRNYTHNLIKNTEIKNAYENINMKKPHVCNKFSGNCSLYCECCMNMESSYNETISTKVSSESRVKKQISLNLDNFPQHMNHFSETYNFLNSILNRGNENQLELLLGKAENLLILENELLRNKISLLKSMMTNYIPHNLGDLFTEGKLYKNSLIKNIFSFVIEEIYNKSKLSYLGKVDKIENIQILNDISHDINISPLAFHATDILLKYGFINCKDYNVSEIASIIAMSEILSKDVQFEVNRLLKAIEDLLKSAGLDRFISNLFAFKNGERVQLSYEETKRIGIVKTDLEKYLLTYDGDLQKCKSKIEDNVVPSAEQNFSNQNLTEIAFTVPTLTESSLEYETINSSNNRSNEINEINQTYKFKFSTNKLTELSNTFSTEGKYVTQPSEETSIQELYFNDTIVTESTRESNDTPLMSLTSEAISFSKDLDLNYDKTSTSDYSDNFKTFSTGTSTDYYEQTKSGTPEGISFTISESASTRIATTDTTFNLEPFSVGISNNKNNVSETPPTTFYQEKTETENISSLEPLTTEDSLKLVDKGNTNKYSSHVSDVNNSQTTNPATVHSEETIFTTQISSQILRNINTVEKGKNISTLPSVERKRIHIDDPPPQYQPIDIDINKVLKLIKGDYKI